MVDPVEPNRRDKLTSTRVIDSKIIESLKIKGGMTAATLKALGLSWSFTRQRNWVFKLRGRVITEEAYQQALAGKEIRASKRRR
jgi:hypothetical protein